MENRFLKLPAVVQMCAISRSEIYRRIKAGTFPRPLKIGKRAAAWRASDVSAWVEKMSRQAAFNE